MSWLHCRKQGLRPQANVAIGSASLNLLCSCRSRGKQRTEGLKEHGETSSRGESTPHWPSGYILVYSVYGTDYVRWRLALDGAWARLVTEAFLSAESTAIVDIPCC